MFSKFVILLTCFVTVFAYQDKCVCDNKLNRKLKGRKEIKFSSNPLIKGEDYVRPKGTPIQNKEDARIIDLTNPCQSEQIHLSLGDDLSTMVVSYASSVFGTSAKVYYSFSESSSLEEGDDNVITVSGIFRVYSELLYTVGYLTAPPMGTPKATVDELVYMLNTSRWAFDPITGAHYSNWYNVDADEYQTNSFGQYNNPDFYYNSPLLFTVELTNIPSNKKVYYRVAGSCDIHEFVMPKYNYKYEKTPNFYDNGGFKMGLTGDVGTTKASVGSMDALAAISPDVILLVGDLSYSDGWQTTWDDFGRKMEDLGSSIPVLTTVGNHEVQSGENCLPYQLRYSTPYKSSQSPDPAIWGREVGPVHVIAINSYSGYKNTSLQYQWLDMYLSTYVNRERTPWLVMMMHVPWYNSNVGHWKEGEKTRANFESLLFKYGVDFVLSGHVHSFERSASVYNNELDVCGTQYFNLGDGGNYEGVSGTWRTPQPDWSVFREDSFGIGEVVFYNDTHAEFSWHRHACQISTSNTNAPDYNMNFSTECHSPQDENGNEINEMVTSNKEWIIKASKDECSNHYMGSSYAPTNPSTLSEDEDNLTTLNIVLIFISSVFFMSTIGLIMIVINLKTRIQYNALNDDELDKSRSSKLEYKVSLIDTNNVSSSKNEVSHII